MANPRNNAPLIFFLPFSVFIVGFLSYKLYHLLSYGVLQTRFGDTYTYPDTYYILAALGLTAGILLWVVIGVHAWRKLSRD